MVYNGNISEREGEIAMVGYFGALAAGLLLLILYIREKIRGASPKALLLKTLVSVAFLEAAFCPLILMPSENASDRLFGFLVLAGLFFGLLGDIYLDLKLVYPAADKIYTLTGFGVFAVGHFFFMAAMVLRYGEGTEWPYLVLPVLLGIAFGIGNGLLEKKMGLTYGFYKTVVILYGAILGTATLLAGSLALSRGFSVPSLNLFFIGLAAFMISDLVLSGSYFGEGHDRPIDTILNYIFYYGAQFLIAATVLLV